MPFGRGQVDEPPLAEQVDPPPVLKGVLVHEDLVADLRLNWDGVSHITYDTYRTIMQYGHLPVVPSKFFTKLGGLIDKVGTGLSVVSSGA